MEKTFLFTGAQNGTVLRPTAFNEVAQCRCRSGGLTPTACLALLVSSALLGHVVDRSPPRRRSRPESGFGVRFRFRMRSRVGLRVHVVQVPLDVVSSVDGTRIGLLPIVLVSGVCTCLALVALRAKSDVPRIEVLVAEVRARG